MKRWATVLLALAIGCDRGPQSSGPAATPVSAPATSATPSPLPARVDLRSGWLCGSVEPAHPVSGETMEVILRIENSFKAPGALLSVEVSGVPGAYRTSGISAIWADSAAVLDAGDLELRQHPSGPESDDTRVPGRPPSGLAGTEPTDYSIVDSWLAPGAARDLKLRFQAVPLDAASSRLSLVARFQLAPLAPEARLWEIGADRPGVESDLSLRRPEHAAAERTLRFVRLNGAPVSPCIVHRSSLGPVETVEVRHDAQISPRSDVPLAPALAHAGRGPWDAAWFPGEGGYWAIDGERSVLVGREGAVRSPIPLADLVRAYVDGREEVAVTDPPDAWLTHPDFEGWRREETKAGDPVVHVPRRDFVKALRALR